MSTRIGSSVSAFAFVRHRTTYCFALLLAGAWTPLTALTGAEVLRTSITVRVYQIAGVPSSLVQRALAEAETVLRSAFVDVRWQVCTGLHPSPTCDMPRGPFELVLVVREAAPRHEMSATLGQALVVRHRAGGGLATVYVNFVAQLSKTAKTDVAMLLGRVAAHELAHLMMRTPTHSRRGLMRPNWTPEEIRRNIAADWAFTSADVAAMRQPAPDY